MPSPYRLIRERLRNPPNAVPDPGIHMHNGWPVAPVRRPLPPRLPPRARSATPVDFWLSLPWAVNLSLPQVPKPAVKHFVVNNVIQAVSYAFDVKPEALLGPRRHMPLALYRQTAFAIARRLTDMSLLGIGRHFGGRDHSTVHHACRKMASYIDAVAAELAPDASPMEWAQAMKRRLEEA